ncbi:MAG: homoserine O-acetyltransferase [Pseudomonadota bacterium]
MVSKVKKDMQHMPNTFEDALEKTQKYVFPADDEIPLLCGKHLKGCEIAYETYGTLNADRSNVILLCHGLTGDQFAAGINPITQKPGWWDHLIGNGKAIDTSKYFVLSTNVLGGCMGSTGPSSLNPDTGKPYAMDFPILTIHDMVAVQIKLLDQLGIRKVACAMGGSMGGMQVLEIMTSFSDRIEAAMAISSSWRHSAQNIAFHEIGRQAIMADPDWHYGLYQEKGTKPVKGLSVARMTAHVTYMSEPALQRKFGRNLQDREDISYNFEVDFQVESYLRYQGKSFVDRFDANCYLYITKALDYFDLTNGGKNCLADAFKGLKARICLITFSSDWLFPPSETRDIMRALNAVGANVSFVEIESDKGHDAFLLEEPEMSDAVAGFLNALAKDLGL